jgi:cyclic pyranopterin monophosphate synthase
MISVTITSPVAGWSQSGGNRVTEKFSHLAEDGSVRMVDVSAKPVSRRVATAEAVIALRPETIAKIESNQVAKGNVLATARIAAIQAVKRTGELIPLCHPLPVQHAQVEFESQQAGIRIECRVTTAAQTGVEMEALTGASIAALTIYDMCKAIDKVMVISGLRLVSKSKESL